MKKFCGTISMITAASALSAAEPSVSLSIQPGYELGLPEVVVLHVAAPEDSMVTVQMSEELSSSNWLNWSSSTLSSGVPLEFEVPLELHERSRFFRVQAHIANVIIEDDGKTMSLKLEQPTLVASVLQAFGRKSGLEVFALNADDNYLEVGPAELTAKSYDDLLRQLGVAAWVLPPSLDDLAFAARHPASTNLQSNPLPDDPATVGTGKMEDGWAGDPNLPMPHPGSDDPQPDPNADKKRDLNVPPLPPGVEPNPSPDLVESGRHLRFVLTLKEKGDITINQAFELPGNGLLPPSSSPGLGALIIVVRSPHAGNAPGQIYSVEMAHDPFVMHSYPGPLGESHAFLNQDESALAVKVPVLNADKTLDGLKLELYRCTNTTLRGELSAKTFLQHRGSFGFLGEIPGESIRQFLPQPGAPASAPRALMTASHITRPSEMTVLHRSGPQSSKFNMVIVGDGFQDTAVDQNAFNNFCQRVIMEGLFTNDIHAEILNAINVFRINTFSTDSGVTQVDSGGNVTVARQTALQYRFSGVWSRCWMEPSWAGPLNVSVANLNDAVNPWVPSADIKVIVLNNPGAGGGCRRDGHLAVTTADDWTVVAHEFGHLFGNLRDEYFCTSEPDCGAYCCSEVFCSWLSCPGEANQTAERNRENVPWREWIPSWRPVPTRSGLVSDLVEDTGLFPGATRDGRKFRRGIFRPSTFGRMNNNAPPHNPPSYFHIRNEARRRQEGDFRKNVIGDFNADGKTDAVILDDRQLSLYLGGTRNVGPDDPIKGRPPRAANNVLEPKWFHTGTLRTGGYSWGIRSADQLMVGDFDADGRDDLYAVNMTQWERPWFAMLRSSGTSFSVVREYFANLPGWDAMKPNDQFYVLDFDGDNRKDVIVYNGLDWIMPYLLMLRCNGAALELVRRYDGVLPGWTMGRHEKFYPIDFDRDGREDLLVHNAADFFYGRLLRYRSTGTGLALQEAHWPRIGGWSLRRNDQLLIADFTGDGYQDLMFYNGRDWAGVYLGLLPMSADGVGSVRYYADSVPGWTLRRNEKFYPADVDGDGDKDLIVFNAKDWAAGPFLGMMRSDGLGNLSNATHRQSIDAWVFSENDSFAVANFGGDAGWEDLFVFNPESFGLLRSNFSHYRLESFYPRWIHNHRFHAQGWW